MQTHSLLASPVGVEVQVGVGGAVYRSAGKAFPPLGPQPVLRHRSKRGTVTALARARDPVLDKNEHAPDGPRTPPEGAQPPDTGLITRYLEQCEGGVEHLSGLKRRRTVGTAAASFNGIAAVAAAAGGRSVSGGDCGGGGSGSGVALCGGE